MRARFRGYRAGSLLLALSLLAACSDKAESVLDHTHERPQLHAKAASDQVLPPKIALAGRVTDSASVFTPTQRAALEARLAAFERESGHQLVVVTASSLDGADVATFTATLANAWGIGRKDWNDGIVLLVAPRERKVRIAVGDGLSVVLDDAICARIIAQDIVPRMQQGDLAGGIEAGATAIIATLGGGKEG